MTSRKTTKVSDIIGGGYNRFWNFKGRYRVCKGSRASKKSKTTALWYAVWLNKKGYEDANLIVFRRTFRTIKDSCFVDLKWALNRIGIIGDWDITVSPLEMTRKSTGQKILFRGLDDPLKVTSVAVEHGHLCWAWIEEAYEVNKEADFDTLDESIRGEVPAPLFKQLTITFNPWSERHWLKRRFFDAPESPDILAMTTNYLCNEWLDKADLAVFERMKRNNPRRYQVAGLGGWGVVDGLVYERWMEQAFTLEQLPDDAESAFGLDFGYTNDPSALFCGFYSESERRVYVWDEMYQKGLSNRAIYETVKRMGYAKERITADSAEPKSIDELRGYGLRVDPAKKGKDSVNNGVQWIQDVEIIIHPRCEHFIAEISNYSWRKDRFDNKLNEPEDDNNHLMDAMRYGLGKFIRRREIKLKTFRGGI